MRPIQSLLTLLIIASLFSCGDKDNDNNPNTSAKKLYLKKVIDNSLPTGPVYITNFDYNASKQLTQITIGIDNQAAVPLATFTYDNAGKLAESKDFGRSDDPYKVNLIRRYTYNAAGQCTGDTSFNDLLQKNHVYDNRYTYDNQGRLLTRLNGVDNAWRWEYGTGKNPVKLYQRLGGMPELEYYTYKKYDDKKPWIGISETLLLYYRSYATQNAGDFFDNNPLEYQEINYFAQSTSINTRIEVKEVYTYNADGYPTKREIFQTTATGTYSVYKREFEYTSL